MQAGDFDFSQSFAAFRIEAGDLLPAPERDPKVPGVVGAEAVRSAVSFRDPDHGGPFSERSVRTDRIGGDRLRRRVGMIQGPAVGAPRHPVRNRHSGQDLEDRMVAEDVQRTHSPCVGVALIDRHDAGVKRSVRPGFPIVETQPRVEAQRKIRRAVAGIQIDDCQRIADAGEDAVTVDRDDKADAVGHRDPADAVSIVRPVGAPFADGFSFDIDENERIPRGDPNRTLGEPEFLVPDSLG